MRGVYYTRSTLVADVNAELSMKSNQSEDYLVNPFLKLLKLFPSVEFLQLMN